MPGLIKTSYDKWEVVFAPIKNTLVEHAPFNGTMFETYGPELVHVHSLVLAGEASRVWTLTDCDGKQIIQEGFHLVNRLGYFITKNPCKPNTTYNVKV